MPIRNVLLLTYHFPPSGAVAVHRMLGLARYLPEFGWQPVVVAPPSVPWEPIDESLLDLLPVATPIERVPFLDGLAGRVVSRIAPEAHWLVRAHAACGRMIAQYHPQALITSSPPGMIHILGRTIQMRHKLPWVACFRDPWVTNSLSRRTWKTRLDLHLESMVMSSADRLVANTPGSLRGWSREYPRHAERMVTIPNGFDPEGFVPSSDALSPREFLSIVHAGELYSGRDPRPFLDALQELRAEGQVFRAEFVGRHTERAYDFSAEILRRGLDQDVIMSGQVPYESALAKMMRADILLLFQTPGYRLGIPAKLFEYLGAAKPILAISEIDSDVAWALRESGTLHRVVSPTDVAGIKKALVELGLEIRAGRATLKDGRAVLKFTRREMARSFAKSLDHISEVVSSGEA